MVDSKVPVDICTTLSYIQPTEVTLLQYDESLKPEKWQKRDADTITELVRDMKSEEMSSKEEFRHYRESYIDEIIDRVLLEQGDAGTDYVDTAVTQKRLMHQNYVCRNCRFVYPVEGNKKKKCSNCDYDPLQHPVGFDVYRQTESCHPSDPPKVKVGEPYMVNPNTLENVKQVLDHVKAETRVGCDDHDDGDETSRREWTIICGDAVPYLLGVKLQERSHICSVCKDEITCEMLDEHSQIHREPVTLMKMYGDILFRPGPGHIELNMARTLLKFLWHSLLSCFVQFLGFRTARAKEVVKNGIDHHRSRQILGSVLEALSCELVVAYIQHARKYQQEPTAKGYMQWVRREVNDPHIYGNVAHYIYLLVVVSSIYRIGEEK